MERKPDQLFRCCFLSRQHSAAFLNQMPSRWVSYGEWIYGFCSPGTHGAHQLGKLCGTGLRSASPNAVEEFIWQQGCSSGRCQVGGGDQWDGRPRKKDWRGCLYDSKAEKAPPAERMNEDREVHWNEHVLINTDHANLGIMPAIWIEIRSQQNGAETDHLCPCFAYFPDTVVYWWATSGLLEVLLSGKVFCIHWGSAYPFINIKQQQQMCNTVRICSQDIETELVLDKSAL